ncbi:MAG: shikimate kinase [Gammaproteobacteria bacterium]
MFELSCFLIGPNGAGKTTVGRILASFLSLKFVDSDLEIEQITGKKIIKLWKENGQEEFYKLETTMLGNVTAKKNIILATNAYSVLQTENRNLFSLHGKIIYLAANPINQYTRVMLSGRQSPFLLAASNKLQYLMELTKTMEPIYSSIADFIVMTDNCGVEEVVNKIIDYLHCRAYCV